VKFSVVIPTRERPVELAKCLTRLAPGAQTFSAADYEVIVTDDGRSTAEVEITRNSPSVRWTKGPQRGPAANRNHGASLARGEWLVFTDDDCLPDPGWLAAFAAAIADDASVAVWEGRTYCAERNPGPLRFAPVNESGGFLWSCNFAIRSEIFRGLGGFDAQFPSAHLEDVDFYRRLKDAGHAGKFLPAASVEHPPRPLGPVWRSALAHESSFYFARKHGLPLAQSGLAAGIFLRARTKQLLRSRTLGEAARFLVRSAMESGVLVIMTPVWRWRYRRR